jgi:biopolymer transport protein ExbD
MKLSGKLRNQIKVGIDPTPLIDMMFLTTIFFMLTSTVIKTSSINVNLPKSITSDSQPKMSINITITKDERIFLNDNPVLLEDVSPIIKKIIVKDPSVPVVIRGDKEIKYQLLVEVMDRVRVGGATEISLLVESKK